MNFLWMYQMEFDNYLTDIYNLIIKEGGSPICLTLARLSRAWKNYTYRFITNDVRSAIQWHDVFSLSKICESWVNDIPTVFVYGYGNISIIKFYVNRCFAYNKTDACIGAGMNSDPEIMNMLKISTDTEWSCILCGAYCVGNIDLMITALNNGASDFSYIAEYLAIDENMKVIFQLINKKPSSSTSMIYGVCKTDSTQISMSIIDYLVGAFPDEARPASDVAIIAYSSRQRFDLATVIVEKYTIHDVEACYNSCIMLQSISGLQYFYNLGCPLTIAVIKQIGAIGCIDTIDWFVGNSRELNTFRHILRQVIRNNRVHILNYLIDMNVPGLVNDAMYVAGKHGNMYIAGSIVSRLRDQSLYGACLYGACVNNNIQMITDIVSQGVRKSTIKLAVLNATNMYYLRDIANIQDAIIQGGVNIEIRYDDNLNVHIR